jgi:hypothetical protein
MEWWNIGRVGQIGYCLFGQVMFADLVGGNLKFIVPEEIRGLFYDAFNTKS